MTDDQEFAALCGEWPGWHFWRSRDGVGQPSGWNATLRCGAQSVILTAAGPAELRHQLLARLVPVKLRVWGTTPGGIRRATSRAEAGPSRAEWDFVSTEQLTGAPCPLDLEDPGSIAAESGLDWAYVAYPAVRADG